MFSEIVYSDDVTQIIAAPRKSEEMKKIKVERDTNRINRYEHQWKIKRNEIKFKILPLAQHKIHNIKVNDKDIAKSKEGGMIGLKI